MRAQKRFEGVALAGATVSRGTVLTAISTLNRCLVPLQAVASNRNAVSRDRLARTLHYLCRRRPPRPRAASAYPLDTGAL